MADDPKYGALRAAAERARDARIVAREFAREHQAEVRVGGAKEGPYLALVRTAQRALRKLELHANDESVLALLDEHARLLKIEAAAQAVIDRIDQKTTSVYREYAADLNALRAALSSGGTPG